MVVVPLIVKDQSGTEKLFMGSSVCLSHDVIVMIVFTIVVATPLKRRMFGSSINSMS